MAYLPERRGIVLFGGNREHNPVQTMRDTWLLEGGTWRQLNVDVMPPSRDRAAMAYDEEREVVVLFGGQQQTSVGWPNLKDTWTFDGERWVQAGGWFRRSPGRRCGHSMAFDRNGGCTVLFGGARTLQDSYSDTWIFDGRWHRVGGPEPPPRRYAQFAWHEELQGCVLSGGCRDDHGEVPYRDVWLFRNGLWERLPFELPVNRDDCGCCWYPECNTMVLLDGNTDQPGLLALNSDGWQPISAHAAPDRVQCAPAVYDPGSGGIIIHGGEDEYGDQQGYTWLLRVEAEP